MYLLLDPDLTSCGKCELCKDLTDNQVYELLLNDENYVKPEYEDCYECKTCEECKNGIGLKSPPGLRGHTMI